MNCVGIVVAELVKDLGDSVMILDGDQVTNHPLKSARRESKTSAFVLSGFEAHTVDEASQHGLMSNIRRDPATRRGEVSVARQLGDTWQTK